ncbi:MAG: sulfite exporter TauE/SafE family protein [Clostridia bacterium]|nr:sulfite exporter TauE/SafE family protein [Clostridia bacterium]MDE6676295.1 sulfite exporter TauE/SafE family protein [Clostridia bacterium]
MNKKTVKFIAGGALTGAANGLFGGGGGMIVVPALERAGNMNALKAHATAIAVILPASIVSAIVYLWYGLVPLKVFLPVALGVLLGGILGAKFLPRISARTVTIIFAAFMLAAGIKMVL